MSKPFASLECDDTFKLTYSWNGQVHDVTVLDPPTPYFNGVRNQLRVHVKSDDGTTFYALGELTGDPRTIV